MKFFKKLAESIIFKIVLVFVALSFVLFGISGFILGNTNQWVAKIGNTTISQSEFNKAIKSDQDIIFSNGKSEDAIKYANSIKFKIDVLNRIISKNIIEKTAKDLSIEADKRLILSSVSKDISFKNEEGKFDHNKFKLFLSQHGLDEKRYVDELSRAVISVLIMHSISMVSPPNNFIALALAKSQNEKRIADIVNVNLKDVKTKIDIDEKDLSSYFEKKKENYKIPEKRKVSYITFSKSELNKNFKISDEQVLEEYNQNKERFMTEETRDFYHALFSKEENANNFLSQIGSISKEDQSYLEKNFMELASKNLEDKNKKNNITLDKIPRRALIKELSDPLFSLQEKQISKVIKSPLGFHVFLLRKINNPEFIAFEKIKTNIKKDMEKNQSEEFLEKKISKINDDLLANKTLEEVVKNNQINSIPTTITIENNSVLKDENLADLVKNSFSLKDKQNSKIMYNKNYTGFYAIRLEEIISPRDRNLKEARQEVVTDFLKEKKEEELRLMSKKIYAEISQNPDKIVEIAKKYQLNIQRKEFSITSQDEYLQALSDKLFSTKLNKTTDIIPNKDGGFSIAVLKEIKQFEPSGSDFQKYKDLEQENFIKEISEQYNSYLLEKYPVKINEKILSNIKE